MINAAKRAGIFNRFKDDRSLFLALEPECAALDFINEKSSDKDAVQLGNNYIVCDIGVELLIYEHIQEKKNILKIKYT